MEELKRKEKEEKERKEREEKERKEREEEERRRIEEEEEEEEIVYLPRYIHTEEDDYTPNVNRIVQKRTICCHLCPYCYEQCFLCRARLGKTGIQYLRTYLYCHKECYPKKANTNKCYLCNASRAPGRQLIYSNSQKYCIECHKEFNHKTDTYCVICRQKLY